jgi:hypothetical protein
MRKVKQSAWRRQGRLETGASEGEGELDGVTIAAVNLPDQLMEKLSPGLL